MCCKVNLTIAPKFHPVGAEGFMLNLRLLTKSAQGNTTRSASFSGKWDLVVKMMMMMHVSQKTKIPMSVQRNEH